MKKDELLSLLEDAEVVRAVSRIVDCVLAASFDDRTKSPLPVFNDSNSEKKTTASAKSLAAMNEKRNYNKVSSATMRKESLEGNQANRQFQEELKQANEKLVAECQKTADAEALAKKYKEKADELERQLGAAKEQITKHGKEKEDWQHDIDSLKTNNRSLDQRNKDLAKKILETERKLEQRFARGWELFEAYREIGSHPRQLLHNGVFPQEDNFMSFICSGAQTGALDKIWDVIRECVEQGQKRDAEILWDVFEYCLELVNSSKAQARYKILATEVGDKFDPDYHTEGPRSKAQGQVLEVYLPGYMNTYNDKIMKKSIVRVG